MCIVSCSTYVVVRVFYVYLTTNTIKLIKREIGLNFAYEFICKSFYFINKIV